MYALSFCPVPVGALLPSWHQLQLRAKLGTSCGLRSWRKHERSVTDHLLTDGLGGVKIQISAWISLWISLSVVCCWRGYIRYWHWAIPKGRLQKENSTSVSFFPGLLGEAVWGAWLQLPNYPWHCPHGILTEWTGCLPIPFSKLSVNVYENVLDFRNNVVSWNVLSQVSNLDCSISQIYQLVKHCVLGK